MKTRLLLIVLLITVSTVYTQKTMILKKDNGVIDYVQISTNVEVTFDTRNPCEIIPTVLYGGQTYNTVQIGDQCWLKENLNIGTRILGSLNQTNNNQIEKYCYSDLEANCTTYGGLYQWAEAMKYRNGANNTFETTPAFSGNIRGICPSGWHIPTNAEFSVLKTAVSSDGNKLKALGQGIDAGAGTNTSGFSALLVGWRGYSGSFGNLGYYTDFWSSTEKEDASAAIYLELGRTSNTIFQLSIQKLNGFSVRCLKD